MEGSCPATPLILTGRNSKSPAQVAVSSTESDGIKSPSRDSDDSVDSRCVICLGKLQNKSFTDNCLHQFCFQCLLQWSKVKAECPLCKQPFKSIIHNVRSNLEYDRYHVEHGEPLYFIADVVHSYDFDLVPVDHRFRYRSTMTREYFRELAENFLAHTRRLSENSYRINPLVPIDPASVLNIRRSHHLHANSSQQRMRQRGASDFRRNIYAQDLWVQDLADISGRYRECTPQFYRENPAQIHRIIPWLNREVNVLLNDCESHAAYVLSHIIALLTQHPIRSREFHEQVQSYFRERTDHFIHELYIFARSVYDIAGFDENAVYRTNPNYATEVQEISSSSDNDSDIEIIEAIRNEERKFKKSRQGLKKLLLKRTRDAVPKSDEPVAGPSGITSAKICDSIEICESDSEEIKVVDYVKPEPEVVILSSSEEMPTYSDLDTSNGEDSEVIYSDINKLRSPSQEDDKKRNKSRSAKGKCKSNGFGLKGKQKQKYIKSRRLSVSSISSRSSTSNSSNNSSNSTDSTTSSSSDSTSNNSSGKRYKSDSSVNASCSHSSIKSRKKKLKIYQKKVKNKVIHKSSGKRHKLSTDANKEKKKRIKSCVVVPNLSCDSSSSMPNVSSRSSEGHEHQSYWSIALNDRAQRWLDSPERDPERWFSSSGGQGRERNRDTSGSSEKAVYWHIESKEKTSTTNSNSTTNYDSFWPQSGDVLCTYIIPTSSSSSHSLPSKSSSQNYTNSN